MKILIWAAQNKVRGRQFDMPALECQLNLSKSAISQLCKLIQILRYYLINVPAYVPYIVN